MRRRGLRLSALVEIIFDLFYLVFALLAGIYLLIIAKGNAAMMLYGSMALTLGVGDMFHLLPRIYGLWTDTMAAHTHALGFGKQLTSITMTGFYVMLFYAWQLIAGMNVTSVITITVWFLAILRIILCLFPQKQWYENGGSLCSAIIRNVPFTLLGALVAILFSSMKISGFVLMPFAICLSFAFYLPVVLFAGKNPKFGALMLPKTCIYVWMICMGLISL